MKRPGRGRADQGVPAVDNAGSLSRRIHKQVHPAAIFGRVMFAKTKLFPKGGRDAGRTASDSWSATTSNAFSRGNSSVARWTPKTGQRWTPENRPKELARQDVDAGGEQQSHRRDGKRLERLRLGCGNVCS